MQRLFWIDLHYACFGIESEADTVTAAPPIAAWMRGKSLTEIKPFLIRKGAMMAEIKKALTG